MRFLFVTVILLVIAAAPFSASAESPASAVRNTAADASDSSLADSSQSAALRMARRIDQHLNDAMLVRGLQPAPICDDADFLRRISLDLTGIVPRVSDLREFLADPSPDKRSRWIDRLLDSPRHPTHLAMVWRRIMLPRDLDPGQLQQAIELQDWLRKQFALNVRYDRFVASFLSATGQEGTGPAVFYQSLELKPEKLASATSRIFLGVQIQCAECHDHPFDHWTQHDFWGYAAFFAQLQNNTGQMRQQTQLVDLDRGEVRIPDTEEVVAPKYPTESDPVTIRRGTRRRQLAIWMASRDNPFLPFAAVNRVWTQMFGRGLVNPVDDLGDHNPPSHPELMNDLVEFLVAQRFDLRQLYRAIANSQAYQRSSRVTDSVVAEPVWFERMPNRRLSAEQLYDSLHRSLSNPISNRPDRTRFIATMQSNSTIDTVYDLGVQQALRMMNGSLTTAATTSQPTGLLAALEAPFLDDDQRLELLFLATLSRPPTPAEVNRLAPELNHPESNRAEIWGDLLWALINSAEYQFVR